MKKIVFLDMDGVLNCRRFRSSAKWNGIDPDRVKRLNTLIERTQAEVVISSSWRYAHSPEKMQELLSGCGFTGKIIGDIPKLHTSRHTEIKRWLDEQYLPCNFVILDDDEDAGVGLEYNYVNVPDGLEDEHVEKAVRILL